MPAEVPAASRSGAIHRGPFLWTSHGRHPIPGIFIRLPCPARSKGSSHRKGDIPWPDRERASSSSAEDHPCRAGPNHVAEGKPQYHPRDASVWDGQIEPDPIGPCDRGAAPRLPLPSRKRPFVASTPPTLPIPARTTHLLWTVDPAKCPGRACSGTHGPFRSAARGPSGACIRLPAGSASAGRHVSGSRRQHDAQ